MPQSSRPGGNDARQGQAGEKSALHGYRVLDLAQGGFCVCGRMLGDLGADVIKIEPPGGDETRRLGPFVDNTPDAEKSLFWYFYNANKRGVTLNLESADGRAVFEEMARRADIVVESFTPGRMEALGLGYARLQAINPRLIMTSVTYFGQEGPKSRYEATDLTAWAASGALYINGEPGREPLDVGYHHQASLSGGAEGATATLIALLGREAGGEGQHIDVSAQESSLQITGYSPEYWMALGIDLQRVGTSWPTSGGVARRLVFGCKDGHVCFTVQGGTEGIAKSMDGLVRWMQQDGACPDWLARYAWNRDYDAAHITLEETLRLEQPFVDFLLTKTKEEIFEKAAAHSIFLAPVASPSDVAHNKHMRQRGFWEEVEHPELGRTLTYPGPFAQMSATPPKIRRRAPLIGEHNREIFAGEMGMTDERLRAAGAIS